MKHFQATSLALLLPLLAAQASIDWDGDTTVTSEGYSTWIIAEAPYASTAPAIDGVIGTGEWTGAVYPLEEVYHITAYEGVMEASFSVMWDETNIYILVEAADSVGMAGQGHKFELYISTAYTRKYGAWMLPGYEESDYQISCVMNPEDSFYELGLYSDQDPLSSFQRVNTIDGVSYVSEVKIAWADLGGLPSDKGYVNSDYIGFEVHTQRNAPDGKNANRTKLGWAGVADVAWANTEEWGTLRLLPGGGAPATWAGYPILNGWVDTDPMIGLLQVESAPWVYSLDMGKYLYMDASYVGTTGAWTWIPK